MKVEVWSDFISEDSYLGKQHLKKALDQFPYNEYVVVEHKAFLLKQNLNNFSGNQGVTKPKDKRQDGNAPDQASTVQIARFPERAGNQIDTILAHRLTYFAREKDKEQECVDQIFTTYFTEHQSIDNIVVLSGIAKKIGLCPIETENILQSNKYTRQIDIDLDEAEQIGVKSLPFIVINETYAIPGTYTVREYLEILISIWEDIKFNPRYKLKNKERRTSFCEGDHCGG